MLRFALRTPVSATLRFPVSRFASPAVVSKPIASFARFYSEEAKKEEAKEEAPEITDKDENALKEELEAAAKEAARLKDLYMRSVADFRNLQESTKREIQKSKDLAIKKFAKDLLETADTFDIALKTLGAEQGEPLEKSAKELADLVEGVKLTQSMFLNTLKRHGLEQIEAIDQKFDPNIHDAVFEAPQAGKEAGTVFFVQQPGYYLNKRVLRPAKVGIVKGE